MDNNQLNDESIIKTEMSAGVGLRDENFPQKIQKEIQGQNFVNKDDKDFRQNKEIAALSYMWIMSVPIFIFRKDSPYVQKHSKQGLFLFILSLFFWFMSTLPFIGWIGLILLIIYIYVMAKAGLKALIGEFYYIPIVTDLLNPEDMNGGEISNLNDEELDKSVNNILNEEINMKVAEKEEIENSTIDEISKKVHSVIPDLEDNK